MNSAFSALVEREFDHGDILYFNAAYFGPSPQRAVDNIKMALMEEARPFFKNMEIWMDIPERVRAKMASLLGVDARHIAHATSTSDLVNRVVNGYPFEEGDRVCSPDGEYPSNILPWMLGEKRLPFEFHPLHFEKNFEPPTAEWLVRVLPENCRILNISHVAFETGKKIDLIAVGKICRERNIFLVVDATQSFGGMAISGEELEGIDILTVSTYKWMLGPYGHAFGYFSERALKAIAHRDGIWSNIPAHRLSASLIDYTLETRGGARRFDRGQAANFLVNAGLEGSLEVFEELGLDNIQAHNAGLRDYFLQHYPSKRYRLISHPDHLSNILTLKPQDGDSQALEKSLRDKNVDISVREGNIRISFHLYNTRKQVERLVELLEIS